MASDSRSTKRKRRLRRNISTLTRQLRAVQTDYFKVYSTLLAVLAQKGEVTVTQGTMQQAAQKFIQGKLTYELYTNFTTPTEFRIRLVEDKSEPSAPATTITHVPDDTSMDTDKG